MTPLLPDPQTETLEEIAERSQFEQWRREQFEECLDLWRKSGTPRFEMAAREIDALRELVDEQLKAMRNTPADDMNHAGLSWQRRARAIREGK